MITFILLFIFHFASCNEWLDDNVPGLVKEYKVHIDPGKEDCYWKYVHPGATLSVNMQVLKGGDGNAGMAVKNSKNEVVHPYQWKQNAEYEEESEEGGYYSICIDNQFSRFAGKLIHLHISTFRDDLWDKYIEELEEMEIGVQNFTESIKNVDQKINLMLQYQSYSRAREGRDYQLMLDNHSWIQYWSLAQCVAIFITTSVQVYCVRKFFTNGSTKSGVKE